MIFHAMVGEVVMIKDTVVNLWRSIVSATSISMFRISMFRHDC
jgi:hypothetical protein